MISAVTLASENSVNFVRHFHYEVIYCWWG